MHAPGRCREGISAPPPRSLDWRRAIHIDDLPWLLSEWLREGCHGVPADAQSGLQDFFLRLSGGVIDAQSGSQDSFLRLSGGVVGFAFKAVIPTDGIASDWSGLREELTKAPNLKLPAHLPYTLVLWSLLAAFGTIMAWYRFKWRGAVRQVRALGSQGPGAAGGGAGSSRSLRFATS